MKYRVSSLPNSSHANRFKVNDEQGKHETVFNISKELIDVWGNPLTPKLKTVMVAYIKKHGWAKEPVAVDCKNSPRSLNAYVHALGGKELKTKKTKKTK